MIPAAVISSDKTWTPNPLPENFQDQDLKLLDFEEFHHALNDFDSESGDKGLLFVKGGDGTLNFAIEKIFQNHISDKVKICYLPSGTGNDFSRTLYGHPDNELALLDRISKDLDVEVACGCLNEYHFINMASFGSCADVTPNTDDSLKSVFGHFSYYIHALSMLSDIRSFRCEFEVDGKIIKPGNEIISFFVANAKYAGGGVQIYNKADPEKDSLDLLIIPDMDLTELTTLILEMQREEPDLAAYGVTHLSFNDMRFQAEAEISCTIDGEHLKLSEGHVHTCPQKLRFLKPKDE